MITKDTAMAIALAYREVETAEKLLQQIVEGLQRGGSPDLRDSFGRVRSLQLGVPSGETSQRLFDVPWSLAKPIIETHIATQKGMIAILTERAVKEAADV